MKKILVLTCLFLNFLGASTWADSELPEAKSSLQNRQDKKFQGLIQVTGLGPVMAQTNGITAGMLLDTDHLLQLEAAFADNQSESFDEKVLANAIGIHYKTFTGNSFYWNTGLDLINLEFNSNGNVEYYFNGVKQPARKQIHLEGSQLAATVSLGNQWQWKNFTLGCDWFGLVFPLYSRLKSGSVLGEVYQRDIDDYNREKEKFFHNTGVILTRFYFGFSI